MEAKANSVEENENSFWPGSLKNQWASGSIQLNHSQQDFDGWKSAYKKLMLFPFHLPLFLVYQTSREAGAWNQLDDPIFRKTLPITIKHKCVISGSSCRCSGWGKHEFASLLSVCQGGEIQSLWGWHKCIVLYVSKWMTLYIMYKKSFHPEELRACLVLSFPSAFWHLRLKRDTNELKLKHRHAWVTGDLK